jgi:hypothetical protein
MPSPKKNQLLVEGVDDLTAVVGLMQHHVDWPDKREDAPVFISVVGSVDQILNRDFLSTKMKESGL